jgi:hypothetical protein
LSRALALGLFLSVGCGQSTPCGLDGGTCAQIAGDYVFVLGEAVSCPVWETHVPPSAVLSISQNGSALSATLWPDTVNPHVFTGTLFSDNSMSISESTQNEVLGIPYGTITGSFTTSGAVAGEPPFYFSGEMYLQGGAAPANTNTNTGAPTSQPKTLGCSGGTTLTAEEQGADFVVPDGG